jgi:hypothetical protein
MAAKPEQVKIAETIIRRITINGQVDICCGAK